MSLPAANVVAWMSILVMFLDLLSSNLHVAYGLELADEQVNTTVVGKYGVVN